MSFRWLHLLDLLGFVLQQGSACPSSQPLLSTAVETSTGPSRLPYGLSLPQKVRLIFPISALILPPQDLYTF